MKRKRERDHSLPKNEAGGKGGITKRHGKSFHVSQKKKSTERHGKRRHGIEKGKSAEQQLSIHGKRQRRRNVRKEPSLER